MKRYGHIFEKITTIENIEKAHIFARKNKAHYTEVKEVNTNPIMLKEIKNNLIQEKYKTSPYRIQEIQDRGKIRTIFKLPYYPDRIMQWAIMLQTSDIFMRSFIYDTYASLPNRGIHLAVKRINNVIRNGGEFCLKIDIKKYFPSINQNILFDLLCRKFKDSKLLSLFYEIIKSIPFGLPIGNYISQWLSNFYLCFFDHVICTKFQLPYFRYMDDIVIFSSCKKELQKVFNFYLKELDKLKLEIKDNYQIFPSKIRGVDFLGYRCFGDYILLRKKIITNIKKKYKNIKKKQKITKKDIASMMSYKGWIIHCDSHRFQNKYFKEVLNEGSIR